MRSRSFNRSAAILTVLAVLSFAPAAQADDPALSSPTRVLADILDCLAEALNGGQRAASTLVAASRRQDGATRRDAEGRAATGSQVAQAD